MNLKLLEELCRANGVSGDESRVRALIRQKIEGHYESCTEDALGNLLVFKKGRQTPPRKLLFSAHMDEVGLMVSHITDEGLLRFVKVGGIDDRVLPGRQVAVGYDAIPGVIGAKAIHQLDADERGKAISWEKLTIDLGCTTKEEAEALAQPGDPVYFVSDFEELGERRIKGKAIDDRFGCAVMIEMICSDLPWDCWFSFVVQEEVGLRGSTVAGHTLEPDLAVVLESTASGDLPGVSGPKTCCKVGAGVVVPFMDRGTIYNRDLYRYCRQLAADHDIPTQTKTYIAGGNDAAALQKAGSGALMLNLSVASRCLHTPCVIADKKDMEDTRKLAFLLAEHLPVYGENA